MLLFYKLLLNSPKPDTNTTFPRSLTLTLTLLSGVFPPDLRLYPVVLMLLRYLLNSQILPCVCMGSVEVAAPGITCCYNHVHV